MQLASLARFFAFSAPFVRLDNNEDPNQADSSCDSGMPARTSFLRARTFRNKPTCPYRLPPYTGLLTGRCAGYASLFRHMLRAQFHRVAHRHQPEQFFYVGVSQTDATMRAARSTSGLLVPCMPYPLMLRPIHRAERVPLARGTTWPGPYQAGWVTRSTTVKLPDGPRCAYRSHGDRIDPQNAVTFHQGQFAVRTAHDDAPHHGPRPGDRRRLPRIRPPALACILIAGDHRDGLPSLAQGGPLV